MKMKEDRFDYMVFLMVFRLEITWFVMEMRNKFRMKLFDKLEMPQRNSKHDKDTTLFVIKSDKSDLFFNQF
jgi:hypothetical protein